MPNCETLYKTAALDLGINPYPGEDKMEYSFRLAYSMVSTWILSSFNDRPTGFETADGRVSKSHVTGNALDVLSSLKKVDPNLGIYFADGSELEFVNAVEEAYQLLGFIQSGRFSYSPETYRKRIALSEKLSLVVDAYRKPMKMVGIAPLSAKAAGDSPFEEIFLQKKTAKDAFESLEKQLDYKRFTSQTKGKIEYYDPEGRGFKPYDPRWASTYPMSLLRFDNGAQYAVEKRIQGISYVGYLPSIYSKWSDDEHFGREGWRIVLGYCASLGKPLKAILKPYETGSHFLKMKLIWMPKCEEAVMLALAWPGRTPLDREQWIIDDAMLPSVKALLEHLSIGLE